MRLYDKPSSGFTVSKPDAYQWCRNHTLAEAGPKWLKCIQPFTYESEPYRTLTSPLPVPARSAPEPTLLDHTAARLQSTRWPLTSRWLADQLDNRQVAPHALKCAEHVVSAHGTCNTVQCNGRWVKGYTAEQLDRLEHARKHNADRARSARANKRTKHSHPPDPSTCLPDPAAL